MRDCSSVVVLGVVDWTVFPGQLGSASREKRTGKFSSAPWIAGRSKTVQGIHEERPGRHDDGVNVRRICGCAIIKARSSEAWCVSICACVVSVCVA